jgi:hypothetical protein
MVIAAIRRAFGHHPERVEFTPPPPINPVEVAMKLRVRREELNLSLESVRDQTGVPRIDLEALESAQLEVFHLEAAAVVALWRYSQLLGLEPDPLVAVIRQHWPRSATGIETLATQSIGPLARIRAAERAFRPFADPAPGRPEQLGLTTTTEESLTHRDVSANATIAALVSERAATRAATRAMAAAPVRAALSAAPDEVEFADEFEDAVEVEPEAAAVPARPAELAPVPSAPSPATQPLPEPPASLLAPTLATPVISAASPVAAPVTDAAEAAEPTDEEPARGLGRIAQVIAQRFGIENEQDEDN